MGSNYLVLFLYLVSFTLFVYPQNSNTNSSQLYQETFLRVWNTVYQRHFDPNFNGVDWKKQHEIYEPKALSAKTDDEFHTVLNQMLGDLNQSHFKVFTEKMEITSTKCFRGTVGINLQMVENQALIYEIEAGSSAEKSGLKTGFAILKINQKPVTEIIEPLKAIFAKQRMTESMKKLVREKILLDNICGDSETTVNLEVLKEKDLTQTIELTRHPYSGGLTKIIDGVPPQKSLFQAKILKDNIGYIKFNVWVTPHAEKFKSAIYKMMQTKGIIIDLRSNIGGLGRLLSSVGGTMFHEKISLGSYNGREEVISILVEPQKQIYDGKVIILTNYGTGSASEVFAAGMQEIGRAKVVGETTVGGVLPGIVEKLPTGAYFMFAPWDYRTPKKVYFEGRGVEPDIFVNLTRQSLLEGRDLQIEAAIKEITK